MTDNQADEFISLIKIFNEKIDRFANKFDDFDSKNNQPEKINLIDKNEYDQMISEIKQELRFMNLKMDVQIEDLLNTKIKIRDYEERIRVLEEKCVA